MYLVVLFPTVIVQSGKHRKSSHMFYVFGSKYIEILHVVRVTTMYDIDNI